MVIILNKYFVTAARILVTVNEISLFNIFLVLLVKTEYMMVSKMGATWIKICFQFVECNKAQLPGC